MHPTAQTEPGPGDSPAAAAGGQPATTPPATNVTAQQDDDLADQLSHTTPTPEHSPAPGTEPVATPPDQPSDSTGITPARWDTHEHGTAAEPVAGVDLDLARAIVAHSSRGGEWTNATAAAAHATMADAVHARQDLGNAARVDALSRQLQRPVTPPEIPQNIFHERAVTAQMWDDAVTHAPEQHRRHTP